MESQVDTCDAVAMLDTCDAVATVMQTGTVMAVMVICRSIARAALTAQLTNTEIASKFVP